MLLNNERKVTEQITRQGLINEEDAQILLDDIDERYKEINTLYINKVLAKQEKFTNYSNISKSIGHSKLIATFAEQMLSL